MQGLTIREFDPSLDSVEEMTRLLNRSYGSLAAMGFRYVASYQDADVTLKRIAEGYCLVGVMEGKIVATICYYPPGRSNGCPLYEQTPHFGQFAVDPDLQGTGIGGAMMDAIEEHTRRSGEEALALDTAEGAAHLISYYGKRGYEPCGYTDWSVTNYRSLLMKKNLLK